MHSVNTFIASAYRHEIHVRLELKTEKLCQKRKEKMDTIVELLEA